MSIDKTFKEFAKFMTHGINVRPIVYPDFFTPASLELKVWGRNYIENEDFWELDPEEQMTELELIALALDRANDEFNDMIIPMNSKIDLDRLHAYWVIFIRMCRFHTPAFIDMPMIFEQANEADMSYTHFTRLCDWIGVYEETQRVIDPVLVDSSWDNESAWRMVGMASRFVPRPLFGKLIESQEVLEAPLANYPAAHAFDDAVRTLGMKDWKESPYLTSHMFVHQNIEEFLAFLYKIRYIVDDLDELKETLDACTSLFVDVIKPYTRDIFEFVNTPQTLFEGRLV